VEASRSSLTQSEHCQTLLDTYNNAAVITPLTLSALRKLDIKIIHSIELISDNPQEVEIQATVIGGYNEFDDEYDAEVGFLFRFLEDAENDEEFISDYGQDPGLEFMIITLDGLKIAVIELEIND
jgi:hypothetical protein